MLKQLGLVLCILWLTAGFAAAAETVNVNAEATVTGPYVTLGEVAEISGGNPDRVRMLRELRLGSAPQPGQRMVLTAETLGMRLAGTGADFGGVIWQVPPNLTIITAGQNISGDRLVAEAAAIIRQRLGTAGENDVTVTALGTPQDVVAPLGQAAFKVELPQGIRLNVPTIAQVAVSLDGRQFTTVAVKFGIKAYQNVVVAARNIGAAEVITADSLRFERLEVGRMAGYLTDAQKAIGLMARRQIAAGMPLTEAALDKPPLVKPGNTVLIVAKIGDITVTASGKVLQQGGEGEVVRVQNVSSNRILTARVVDSATVEVIIYSGR